MSGFGAGLVSGLAGGYSLGAHFKDAWAESDVDDAVRQRTKEGVSTQDQLINGDTPSDGTAPGWNEGRVDQSIYGAPETEAPGADGRTVTADEYAKEWGEPVAKVSAEGAEAESAPYVDPVGKRASTTKKVWSIGEGEHKKIFDVAPTEAEVRQWKFDTIQKTAGDKYAEQWMDKQDARDIRQQQKTLHAQAIDEGASKAESRNALSAIAKDVEGNAELESRFANITGTDDEQNLAYSRQYGNGEKLDAESWRGIARARDAGAHPANQYLLAKRRADAVARTDPAAAAALYKDADKNLAGSLYDAYQRGDNTKLKELFNVHPRDGVIASARIDPVSGDIAYIRPNGEKGVLAKKQFISSLASYDVEKAMRHDDAEAKLAGQKAQYEERLASMRDKLQFGGGAGAGKGKAPPVTDLLGVAEKFKETGTPVDPEQMSIAWKFLPGIEAKSGGPGDKAGTDAIMVAKRFKERRDAFLKATPGATETQMQDALMPEVVNSITGGRQRHFLNDVNDPAKGSVKYGEEYNPAPAIVQGISSKGGTRFLPMAIEAAAAGKLDDSSGAEWDGALKQSIAQLPEERQSAIVNQWGAASLKANFGQKTAPKKSPDSTTTGNGIATVKAGSPRSPEDSALIGARPDDPLSGIIDTAKNIGGFAKYGLNAATEHFALRDAERYVQAVQNKSISDGEAANFAKIIASYPEMADRLKLSNEVRAWLARIPLPAKK